MKKKKHRAVFLIFLILLFGLFSAQNLIKKHDNYEDLPDLLVFETSFYNTLKGDFLMNPVIFGGGSSGPSMRNLCQSLF
jgi:hypothetical protein